MAYPYKTISMFSIFTAVFLLNGCTQLIEGDQAWPGVSAGTVSSAPDFTAPVGGGQFGQRTPPDVLQNTYGYRGEDLAATAPGSIGTNGLYSYDSSKESTLNAETLNNAQNQNTPSAQNDTSSETSAMNQSESGGELYDPADPVEDWLAEEGQSLKSLLTEWSDESGWRLIWNSNRNYTLSAGAMFRGRFADVSSALIRSFARARPAPIATFYKGNRVLVVTTQEDENAD